MRIYSNLRNFIFLDIEVVREYKDYATLIENKSVHNWERVAKRFMKEDGITIDEAYRTKAGLYVEYGKIVSICVGIFDENLNPLIGNMKGDTEEALLRNFVERLDTIYGKNANLILCGHNIKEFDIPYIIKRLIKHGIKLPKLLYQYMNAKSWEVPATDTQYDWRMAGNRFMNLDTIAEFLSIPSSKDGEVNGENLGEYYWTHNDPIEVKIGKINHYCKEDVRVTMDLAKKFNAVIP